METKKIIKNIVRYLLFIVPVLLFSLWIISPTSVTISFLVYIRTFDLLYYILQMSLLFFIVSSFILLLKEKKKKQKLNVFYIVLIVIYLLLFILNIPKLYIGGTKGPFSATIANMNSVSKALEHYYSLYGYYPDSYVDKYPASKNGILLRENIINYEVYDPLTKGDYHYFYDTKHDTYEIYCPNPDYYRRILRKKYDKNIKYVELISLTSDGEINVKVWVQNMEKIIIPKTLTLE